MQNLAGNYIDRKHKGRLINAHANLAEVEANSTHTFVAGSGVIVIDDRGQEYIDGISGMWCAGLGYDNGDVIAAIEQQLNKLPYCTTFNSRTSDVTLTLVDAIAAITPAGLHNVFFVNSGSEANDSALKMVWYYQNARGKSKKKKILTFDKSYHGSTVAAASLCGLEHMHESFDLPLLPVVKLPSPVFPEGHSAEAIDAYVSLLETIVLREDPETLGAVFAEPVMGAGGVIIPPSGLWPKLCAMFRRHDILIVADEVITGFCRTGYFFGSEAVGITPDIMTLAKIYPYCRCCSQRSSL